MNAALAKMSSHDSSSHSGSHSDPTDDAHISLSLNASPSAPSRPLTAATPAPSTSRRSARRDEESASSTSRRTPRRDEDPAARRAHPLRQPSITAVCTESLTNPSTSRLLLAALGLPVEYFVSNVEPELQAELAGDETQNAEWQSTVDVDESEDPLKAPWVAAVKAMSALRDARKLRESSTTAARRIHAEKQVSDTLLALQELALREGRFMASYRGEAGETIAHMACLLQLHDVLLALLDMEPMLIAEAYSGTQYKGETLLHMLCASGSLLQLRRFAQRALYPRDEIVYCGPPLDRQQHRASAVNRSEAWRLLWEWERSEAQRSASRGTDEARSRSTPQCDRGEGPDSEWVRSYFGVRGGGQVSPAAAGPDSDWCRAWLRAAWGTLVNARCTGTFFQPQPEGTCDYGGTALSFAAVLGYVDVVRFLVVEAGCAVPALWAEVARHEALRTSETTFARLFDERDDPCHQQPPSTRGLGAEETGRVSRGGAGVGGGDDGSVALGDDDEDALAERLREQVEEERLTMYPGALGSAELLVHWEPSLCARIDMQDEFGNTAGHLAVLHYANANMFNFLSGLYQKGYGRVDTEALYAAPHAQLARAVALLPSVASKHAELAHFSASPGLDPSTRLADAAQAATSHGFSAPGSSDDAVSVDAMSTKSAALTAHPTLDVPSIRSPQTAPALGALSSWAPPRTAAVVPPLRQSRPPPLLRSASVRVNAFLGSLRFGSIDAVEQSRPNVFASGSQQSLAFMPPPGPRSLWNPAVVATALVDYLASQPLAFRPARSSIDNTPSGHTGPRIPAAWRELQTTVQQKLEGLPSGAGSTAVAARRSAAGLAFIQNYATEIKLTAAESRPQLIDLLNHEGLTPFTLGGREGKRAIVEALWRSNSKLAWAWGGVTAHTYALDQVDDIGQIADAHRDIVQTVSQLQSQGKSRTGPGDALAALFCCCGQRAQSAARGCFLGRGRTMQTAACCCGPRQLYRIPPPASSAAPETVTPVTVFFRVLEYAVLPLRFILHLSPVAQAAPRADLGVSSRTVMHEIVRGGHWHLLEPSKTATQGTAPDVLKGSALSAAIAVQGVTFANATQMATGRALFMPHDKEASQELYQRFRGKARDLAMHEAAAAEGSDDDEAEDEEAAGRSSLSGASAEQEDPGRQLLQLVQRKWNRVYAVQFYRLMLARMTVVLYAWGAITVRAGYASAGTQFDLSCEAPNNTDSQVNTIGSCHVVRLLIGILTAGALWMLLVNGWRLAVLGGPSIWRALLNDRHSHVRKPLRLSHQAAAYVAGHSGAYGKFYVATLILASALIGVGGIIDFAEGWANAAIFYSIGGFFAGSHMVYYLLGFGTTGPLVVMLAVALPTFSRWMFLFVPTLLIFSFSMFVLLQPHDHFANGFQNFFRTYLLGSFDNSMQPQPTAAAATTTESAGTAVQVLYVIVLAALILISSIALMAILIAIMTHAFEAHLASPRSRWHIERARIILQLESAMTAWERLSVPLNNRYFIWATTAGGGDAAASKRGSLLALPPSSWLGDPTSEARAQVALLREGAPGGVGGVLGQSGGQDAAASTLAIAMSVAPAPPARRRPFFYCQAESSAAPHKGTRAKAMLDAQHAAPGRALVRLAALEAAETAAAAAAARQPVSGGDPVGAAGAPGPQRRQPRTPASPARQPISSLPLMRTFYSSMGEG